MVFSEYLSAAKGAITYVKGQVRYRGLNTGGGWIRDPLDVPQKFAARIKSLNMASEKRAAMANIEAAWDQNVDQWIREALASQTGNCCELSAIAFRYLQRQGIRPVEFFGVYRGSWNHAFVVLNRDQSVPVSDFANWSRLAVVCDPPYDRAGDAGFLATWRRGIGACFRCVAATSNWFQRSPRKMQDTARVARNACGSASCAGRRHFKGAESRHAFDGTALHTTPPHMKSSLRTMRFVRWVVELAVDRASQNSVTTY